MRSSILLATVVLQAVVVISAQANPIPDPICCVSPPCIRVCPGGDLEFQVKVRDANNMPLGGEEVRIIFGAEADAAMFWCGEQSHPVVSGITDSETGEITFNIRAGGCFDGDYDAITIEADPYAVRIGAYENVGSTDLHSELPPRAGDGEVNLHDFVVFASKFLTSDYCADYHDSTPGDYQCDEDVDLDDFVIFFQHFLHECQ